MAAPRTPMDIIRALGDQLFPRRVPAETIGYANGVLTVAVEGRISNVEYAGTDELLAGYKVWLRKNPDDPHGSYAYDGPRLEGGTIHHSPPQTNVRVRQPSVDDHVIVRVYDGNNLIQLPDRRTIEFRGSVTITDDPINNRAVVYIIGGAAGTDADFEDSSIDFNDTNTAFGG
jgi:hypothetical protein